MSFKMSRLEIPEVLLIEPQVRKDSRGYFLETFRRNQFMDGGIGSDFVQENFSHSVKDTLRGLHCQIRKPQAKLVTCLNGKIFDVAVDIRTESPTFKKWVGVVLTGECKRSLFIPEGFAHGFCVLSDSADVLYKCSNYYDPEDDFGILWSDPDIAIEWPVAQPLLSEKDSRNKNLEYSMGLWGSR